MKAIKIASGVAVSALALAISAQANAAAHEGSATETTFSYTGGLKFLTVVDMAEGYTNRSGDEVSVIDVELDEEDDADDEGSYGLYMNIDVVHGPFSGGLSIEAEDGDAAEVGLNDIVITDGAISFGQVGELIDTADYAYDMDESEDVAAFSQDEDEGRAVDAAIRYTSGGLKVQIEGANRDDNANDADGAYTTTIAESDYGVGAQYTGSADALEYVGEVQFRTSSNGGDDDTPYTYVGAGVTYTTDMVMAKAAMNSFTVTTDATEANGSRVNELGFEVVVTPVEGLQAYVKGVNWDLAEEVIAADRYLFGAAYTIDVITLTGEYELTTADGGDSVLGKVEYAQDMIAAYASVEVGNIDDEAADPVFEAGVSYTQANDVVYAADYEFQNEGANNLKLSAAYNF